MTALLGNGPLGPLAFGSAAVALLVLARGPLSRMAWGLLWWLTDPGEDVVGVVEAGEVESTRRGMT